MKKLFATALCLVSLTAGATTYQIELLPPISAGGDSLAYALNDNGMVVGWSENTTTGVREAAVWSGGTVTSLGVAGIARGVNNAGTVVGETGDFRLGTPNGQAFTWSGSGPVGYISDLGLYSGAYDINESGVVTGFTCTNEALNCVTQSHGFRSTDGLTMTDLGGVSTPLGYSRGHGINDAGEIVGRASLIEFPNSDKHLAYWDATNSITSIVSAGIGPYSTAQQINNNGIIVGNGFDTDGLGRGMIWDADFNLLQVLGTFGGNASRIWSLNDLGVVVGFAQDATNANRAMVSFDGGATLLDLNDLVSDMTGWASLEAAYDINESGQIVGIGTLDSGERGAFLLTATVVPLPAAVWLFGSALAMFAGFVRRR